MVNFMNKKTCVIALTGKGGVGKTSLSASIVRILTEEKPEARILAIDADPAIGLSVALGVEVTETLDQIRRRVAEDVTGWEKRTPLKMSFSWGCSSSFINCLGRRVTSYSTRDAKEIAKLLAMAP